MYKVYKFTSDKKVISHIKDVHSSSWWNYDHISNSNKWYCNAVALKETDLILFMLANPCLNLMSKII